MGRKRRLGIARMWSENKLRKGNKSATREAGEEATNKIKKNVAEETTRKNEMMLT